MPEDPGKEVAARARVLVDEQHLGPEDPRRKLVGHPVHRLVGDAGPEVPVHEVHHVVVQESSAIEALVDDGAGAVLLREVVPVEGDESRVAGVRYPDVGQAASRELVHPATVVLHPGALAELPLVGHGHHDLGPGVVHGGRSRHVEAHLLPHRSLEGPEGVLFGRELHALHGQEVVALAHLHPGPVKGGRESRIPLLGGEDAGDAPPPVRRLQVRPQESHRGGLHPGEVAAPEVRVPHGELRAHLPDDVVQIAAVSDVFDEGGVAAIHRIPVSAMGVRVIEEVPLHAPGFVEDLAPLHLGIDARLKVQGEASGGGVGRTRRVHNSPLPPGLEEDAGPVPRNRHAPHPLGEDLGLPGFETEDVERGAGLPLLHLGDEDRAPGAGQGRAVAPHRHGERHDAPLDAVEVDADLGGIVAGGPAAG